VSKHSLLLVDGDTRSLRVLEVSLRKAGFTVTPAGSVQDALDKLELDSPDLIISETTFPDGDGFELRRRVRATADWAEIPFVFLTASTAIENKIKGLELGVDDYLTKPIYIKEIITRINILLQKKQRTRFEERRDGRTRFAGRVADMPVIDVIQTIEISRKSGVIQFVGERGRQAAIFFRDGKVIDAEAGALQGEDAVYRLLTWSEGEFEVMFRTVRRREVITTSSQGLLMEGMRRLDEWSRLLEQLPSLTHRFEVDTNELVSRLGDVPDDNNRILRLIDGKRTLLEVIDASDVGDLECLQAISRLFFEGLLVDLDHGAPAKRDTGKPMPLVEIDESPTPIEEVASGPHYVGSDDLGAVPSSAAIRDGSGPVRSREDSGLISMPLPRTASNAIPRTVTGSSHHPSTGSWSPSTGRTVTGSSSAGVARTISGPSSGPIRTTTGSGPVARTTTGSGPVARTTTGSGPVARTATGDSGRVVRVTTGESGPIVRTSSGLVTGTATGHSGPIARTAMADSGPFSRTPTDPAVARTATGSLGPPPRSTTDPSAVARSTPASITIPTAPGRTITPSSITIPRAPSSPILARTSTGPITPSRLGAESISYRPARPSTHDDLAIPRDPASGQDSLHEVLPDEPLLGQFRPSGLRLIDEAVAAAQAIEPSLFAGDREGADARTAASERDDRPTSSEAAQPRGADDSGTRTITSLGRDRAEAFGELTPAPAPAPVGEDTAPQRELVTILPRRITREMPAVSIPGLTDVGEDAPMSIEREPSSKMRVPEARTTTGEIRVATARAVTNKHVIASTGDVRTTERTTGEISIGEPGAAAPARRTPPGQVPAVEGAAARTPTGSFRVVELDRRDSGPIARPDPRATGLSVGIDPRTGAPIERTTGEIKAIDPTDAAAMSSGVRPTATASGEGRRSEASGEIRPDELKRRSSRASGEMRAQGDFRGSTTRSSGAHEVAEHVSGEIRVVRPKTEGRTVEASEPSTELASDKPTGIAAAERATTGELPVVSAVEPPATTTDADGARVLPPRPETRSLPPPTRRLSLEGSGVRRKAGPGAGVIVLLCLAGIAAAIAVYLRIRKNAHHDRALAPPDALIAPDRDPTPAPPASLAPASSSGSGASSSGSGAPSSSSAGASTTTPPTSSSTGTTSAGPTSGSGAATTQASSKTEAGTGTDTSPEGKIQLAKQLMEKAQTSLDTGQAQKAVELCDQSLKLRRTARTLLLKGQALYKLDHVDDALAAVSDANLVFLQSEGRDFPAGWELKGKILWGAQRYDDARLAYQHFLELEPNGKAAAEARRRLAEPR